jgi:hypothetical protein
VVALADAALADGSAAPACRSSRSAAPSTAARLETRALNPAGAPAGLLQLFDSQFPVGAFAHSSGVETYAALGGSAPELRQILQRKSISDGGRSELAAACLAWRAAADLDTGELNRLAVTLDALKVVPVVREHQHRARPPHAGSRRRLYPEAAVAVTRRTTRSSSARPRGASASTRVTSCSHSRRASRWAR